MHPNLHHVVFWPLCLMTKNEECIHFVVIIKIEEYLPPIPLNKPKSAPLTIYL